MNKDIVRAKDVMIQDYAMIDRTLTVAEALASVAGSPVQTFIVDKRDDNDEYGIVQLSDIAKQVLAKDRAPERVNIYEVMSKPVIAVDAEMDVRYSARLFDKFGIKRAPVMQDGKIIGILGYTSMVMGGLAKRAES